MNVAVTVLTRGHLSPVGYKGHIRVDCYVRGDRFDEFHPEYADTIWDPGEEIFPGLFADGRNLPELFHPLHQLLVCDSWPEIMNPNLNSTVFHC